ncbi:MAG: TlpA family protein disulfide reductase [Bacteroidaceae bacterium]|nr:TlpA family protein disulfide reductase [Bacteroidaceae bacterium]
MRRVFLTITCVIATLAFAQNDASLCLKLKGLEPTDTLTLEWGATNKTTSPTFAQQGAKGENNFSISLQEPRLILVGVKGYAGEYEIVLSPGEKASVTGLVKKKRNEKHNDVFFQKMHANGAKHQAAYEKALHVYKQHQDSIDIKVFNEYKDVHRFMEKAKHDNNEEAIAEMYQTMHGESYIDRVMNTFLEREHFLYETVEKYSGDFMGPLLLLRLAGRLDKSYQPLYDKMGEGAKNSAYGREVKEEVYPLTLVGTKALPVTVTDTEGNEKEISFYGPGIKYTLIDFWASWCEPCRKEIPNLKLIYERYADKGLRIVSISADAIVEDWDESLEELKMPWQNYIDLSREAIKQYNVQYIPKVILVDSKGNIIEEKLRGKEISDALDKLF